MNPPQISYITLIVYLLLESLNRNSIYGIFCAPVLTLEVEIPLKINRLAKPRKSVLAGTSIALVIYHGNIVTWEPPVMLVGYENGESAWIMLFGL